jgi:hypothetical protein
VLFKKVLNNRSELNSLPPSFITLLKFVNIFLWPIIHSVMENVPCVIEKNMYSEAV